MTSVKEFVIGREPTASRLGRGRFAFTDAYSVFDWGPMPDAIPGKGASLCTTGAYTFEALESEGVPTHYRGVVDPGDESGGVVPLSEATGPPREMGIDLTVTPELPHGPEGYDYGGYYDAIGDHYLIPLEVVFRNSVPLGSSLRKRRDPREVGLDRSDWPDEPVPLPEPIVEFSTKFEEQDRYLDRAEAERIAGSAPLGAVESLALAVDRVVTDLAEAAGLVHQDGKIECVFRDGEVAVADVVGTFDENRFSYDGQQLSKEVLRGHYRRKHPEWVEAVDDAKARATEEEVANWRRLCSVDPPALAAPVVDAVADLYAAGADSYADGDRFDAPPLTDAVDRVRSL